MKRSTVSIVLALVAVVALVSVAHGVPREEITLTTIIPDQQVLIVKKGVVGYNYRRACAADPDNYVQNNNLLIEGNVGIGTTDPKATLDVVGEIKMGAVDVIAPEGTQRYNKTTHAFEYHNGTTWQPLGGGGFGDWTARDSAANLFVTDKTYLAGSDGFVIGFNKQGNVPIEGWTDSGNPPTTSRAYVGGYTGGCFVMPVKNGDYWKVNVTGTGCAIFWIPIGNGASVKQE